MKDLVITAPEWLCDEMSNFSNAIGETVDSVAAAKIARLLKLNKS